KGSPVSKARVAVWVEIPAEAFRGPRSPPEMVLELDARALDAGGGERDSFSRRASFDVAEVGGRLAAAGLRLYGSLLLSPGSYSLELSVRLPGSGGRADRRLPFEVSAHQPGEPALLPPFFLDDLGEAVILGHSPNGPERQMAYPFVTPDGERFVPVGSPQITAESPRARICLYGSGLLRADSLLDAVLVAEDGTPLSKDRLVLLSSTEGAAESAAAESTAGADPGADAETGAESAPAGLDRLLFALDAAGLAPGTYGLEVRLHALGKGSSRSTYMPFRVMDGGSD
ncbi:MAG: hypothetical protein MI919_29290, partial [Holophagales bacterium]|nr:hypothetical protein [Holophagales bacterium]